MYKDMEKIQEEELLKFINECLDLGYNIYSNVDDINELVEIIVNWYKIKYPDYKIELSIDSISKSNEKLSAPSYRNIENLHENMGYIELIYRIPERIHPIIECWYKGEESEGRIEKTYIFDNKEKNKDDIYFGFCKYDGFFQIMDQVLINNFFKISCANIEQFIDDNNKNNNYIGIDWDICSSNKIDYDSINFDNPKKIVKTHDLDLELRNKIFKLISLKLFNSNKDARIGFIRAKLFAEEFNKYLYKLNFNKPVYVPAETFALCNKIINDLNFKSKTEETKIEENGLTIETLKTLKYYNIKTNTDLLNIDFDRIGDGVCYYCERDRRILNNLTKEMRIKVKKLSNNSTESSNIAVETQKVKKRLFGWRKKS